VRHAEAAEPRPQHLQTQLRLRCMHARATGSSAPPHNLPPRAPPCPDLARPGQPALPALSMPSPQAPHWARYRALCPPLPRPTNPDPPPGAAPQPPPILRRAKQTNPLFCVYTDPSRESRLRVTTPSHGSESSLSAVTRAYSVQRISLDNDARATNRPRVAYMGGIDTHMHALRRSRLRITDYGGAE
jgi:hypothetical protein